MYEVRRGLGLLCIERERWPTPAWAKRPRLAMLQCQGSTTKWAYSLANNDRTDLRNLGIFSEEGSSMCAATGLGTGKAA